MGLFDKINSTKTNDVDKNLFDENELRFLLMKMRTATYTGNEFEMFYNIWVKITNELEK